MEDFKVGDKVIVKDLRKFNSYESPCIVPDMYQYINTIQTILSIISLNGGIVYLLKNNVYRWNALWLSSLEFDKKMWK